VAEDSTTPLPTAPPDADRLTALDDGLWRRVVAHLRRAMAEVAEVEADPRLRRLVAVPSSRLVGGRARRDVVTMLASGGPLWMALRRRVLADPALTAALAEALAVGPTPAPPAAPEPAASVQDQGEVTRLRERVRQLKQERDAARRRAEGEAARADGEVAARQQAEAALAAAEERVAELRALLDDAASARASAVDRERRRGEAALVEVNEQLRRVRREQQEAVQRRRAADRAAAVRTSRPEPSAPVPPPRLVPGRPSRLPGEVHPDTTEAVQLLLHPGRRVLVDGYNVTRSHRDDLDLEGQRRWLVNLVAGAVASRRIEGHVVFDGHGTPGRGSGRRERGVQVAFTDEDVTADDDLVFRVAALPPDEPVVVVTDDRELRERLSPYRVDLVSTGGFVAALR
jgi:hypothetical protein